MNSNSNTNIVELIDNEPRISHRVIAEQTENKEHSVSRLIRDNSHKFELFGVIGFEIHKLSETNLKDGRPEKTYFLNEQQATLLISMMRNNDIVLDFKVRLVAEFFRMRELLQNQKSQPIQPQTQNLQLPEIGNSTEQIIELKNDVLETSSLIEILRNLNPIDLFRLDKFYRKFHNFSLLEHFEIDLDLQFFLPTELGRMINKSPVEVNLILEHKGFQLRENGIWKLTEIGRDFGIEINGKFVQIKWKIKSIV